VFDSQGLLFNPLPVPPVAATGVLGREKGNRDSKNWQERKKKIKKIIGFLI